MSLFSGNGGIRNSDFVVLLCVCCRPPRCVFPLSRRQAVYRPFPFTGYICSGSEVHYRALIVVYEREYVYFQCCEWVWGDGEIVCIYPGSECT